MYTILTSYFITFILKHLEAQLSQKQYHQEFNPPPEGSITGVQSQEQITTVSDAAYDEQQVGCVFRVYVYMVVFSLMILCEESGLRITIQCLKRSTYSNGWLF